jgi:pimeloyl-ACP methyl ester carboxylesterase
MTIDSKGESAGVLSAHRRILQLERGRFEYLEAGPKDGSLLLALHGFPDSPHGLMPLVERAAARGHRVIAPFLRGYGRSIGAGPFDLDTLVDDVLAIARAFGDRFALIGHDWGAVITYGVLAREAPVSAAVTLSVPHPVAFALAVRDDAKQLVRSAYMAFFQLGRFAERRVTADDFRFIDSLWNRWSPSLGPHPAIAEAKAALAPSFPAPLEYYRTFARTPGKLRALARRRITIPTLHLTGREDGCIGPEVGDDELRFFRGPYLRRVVDGAGHFLVLERPDEVSALALDWISAEGW